MVPSIDNYNQEEDKMEIINITLNNWQGYYGSGKDSTIINVRGKSGKRNLIVYGQNTHGKTALWQSIQYAFYGRVNKRKTGWEDGKYKPLVGSETHLEPLLNIRAHEEKDYSFSVELEFEHGDCRYQLIRSHTMKKEHTIPRNDRHMRSNFTIRNLENSSFESEPEKFIQSILPERLAQFFMFDGERLDTYRKLFEEDKDVKLKEYIGHVLRMPVLIDGVDDFDKLAGATERKITKFNLTRSNNKQYLDDFNRIKAQQDDVEEAIEQRALDISELKDELSDVDSWLLEHDQGAQAMAQIEIFESQIEDLEGDVKDLKEKMKKELPNSWRAILTPRVRVRLELLGSEIDRQEEENRQIGSLQSSNDALRNQLDGNPCSTCGHIHQNLSLAEKDEIHKKIISNEETIEKLEETRIDPNPTYLRKRQESLQRLSTDLNLNNLIDIQKDLLKKQSKIRSTKQLLKKAMEKITSESRGRVQKFLSDKSNLTKDIGRAEGDQEADKRIQREYSIRTRSLMEKMGGLGGTKTAAHINAENKFKLIQALRNIWEDVREHHREDMRRMVEKHASKVFIELTNKKETYSHLSIKSNFEISIITKKNKRDAGSSGQSALVAYSILDALTQLSGINFPMIIDTPGRSLDDGHVMDLFSYLFNTDRQVFLFPEGKELKPDIGDDKFGSYCAATYEIKISGDDKSDSVITNRVNNLEK